MYKFWQWLLATCLTTAVVFALSLAQQEGFINVHDDTHIGLFIAPILAGVSLALTNRRVLWSGSILILPLAFCVAMLISFGGLVAAAMLQLEKSEMPISVAIAVENLPFMLAGLLLFRLYAGLAGRGSWWLGLLLMVWSGALSVAIFNEFFGDDIILMQTLYLGGAAALLSAAHWGETLPNTVETSK